jgi:hypothetical protein
MTDGITFVGGAFDGFYVPEGDLAKTFREQAVVVINVDPEDAREDLPQGTETYHVDGAHAYYMAAHNGLAH